MIAHIGLSEADRLTISEALAVALADSYAVYLKTHIYHWNVTGPQFHSLHTMFEAHYSELQQAVDTIAERIRALGFPAPASATALMRLTNIGEENTIPDAESMTRNLLIASETLGASCRKALIAAEQVGDQASADLMTQRVAVAEKNAWMLRATLS